MCDHLPALTHLVNSGVPVSSYLWRNVSQVSGSLFIWTQVLTVLTHVKASDTARMVNWIVAEIVDYHLKQHAPHSFGLANLSHDNRILGKSATNQSWRLISHAVPVIGLTWDLGLTADEATDTYKYYDNSIWECNAMCIPESQLN